MSMSNTKSLAAGAIIIVALGSLFTYLQLPAGWLIAGLLGAATVALVSRRELTPPAKAMSAAQGVIGVVAVEPLTKLTTSDLIHFAGCAAFSVTVTLTLSIGFGVALAYAAKGRLDTATANLSLIAGGASTISCMAKELGADERYVALSQYLRLTIVVLSMPMVLGALGTVDNGPHLAANDHWNVLGMAAMAALIVIAARAAKFVKMPAPYLLGPLGFTTVVAIVDPALAAMMSPTTVITSIAYVVIGWQAGGGFALDVLRQFVRMVPLTLGFIAMTMASCFGVAVIVSHWAGVSLADAYLATTPGGIYGVLAIANEVHAGPIVVTLQILRLVTMVFAAGMIPKVIGWLDTRSSRTATLVPA